MFTHIRLVLKEQTASRTGGRLGERDELILNGGISRPSRTRASTFPLPCVNRKNTRHSRLSRGIYSSLDVGILRPITPSGNSQTWLRESPYRKKAEVTNKIGRGGSHVICFCRRKSVFPSSYKLYVFFHL